MSFIVITVWFLCCFELHIMNRYFQTCINCHYYSLDKNIVSFWSKTKLRFMLTVFHRGIGLNRVKLWFFWSEISTKIEETFNIKYASNCFHHSIIKYISQSQAPNCPSRVFHPSKNIVQRQIVSHRIFPAVRIVSVVSKIWREPTVDFVKIHLMTWSLREGLF